MKIEIHSAQGADGYKIYADCNAYPIRNFRQNTVDLHGFDEQDIANLLAPAQYKKFETGEKYQFDVPKNKLLFVQGQKLAQTRAELEMYDDLK